MTGRRWPDGKTVYWLYDANSNLTALTGPDGGTTYYYYDARNLVTNLHTPDGNWAYYSYDEAGNVLRRQNPNGTLVSSSILAGLADVYGQALVVNQTGNSIVAGAAPNNSGQWQGVTGITGTAAGVLISPNFTVASPVQTSASPIVALGAPVGVLDSGGGGSDLLVANFSNMLGFLTFPLQGMTPGVNQDLTPHTAQINTVFDHMMLQDTGHFSVYGCDRRVEDFVGEVGNTKPSKFHVLCRHGYQNIQPEFNFLVNIANYSGNRYLYYDGHPGYDFQSGFGNQVYAATAGTISYPTASQLASQGIYVGGNPDVYNVLELDPGNGDKIFYLHLSTHARSIAIQQPLTTNLTGENFIATRVGKPGKRIPGTLPINTSLSISGNVTLNGQGLAGVQMNLNSNVPLGPSGTCTVSTRTDSNGGYMFAGLTGGYYYNIYVSPTQGYSLAAETPVFEVAD